MLKAQKQKGQNLGGAWSVGEGFRERVSFALLAQKGWMWGGEQFVQVCFIRTPLPVISKARVLLVSVSSATCPFTSVSTLQLTKPFYWDDLIGAS